MNIELLDDDGRLFLQHARTLQGKPIAAANCDVTTEDDLTNPLVSVRSTISYSERARRFGVEGLSRHDWSGARGVQGHPIPTEEWIAATARAYGDHRETRTLDPYRYRREGTEAAINHCGRDLRELITTGEFEVCDEKPRSGKTISLPRTGDARNTQTARNSARRGNAAH